MSDHYKRLLNIGRFAPPPEGTRAFDELEKRTLEKLKDPKFKKWSKDNFNRCKKNLELQLSNGCGLIIDPELRWFQQEFNVRNWEHGLRSMPTSFNIMEAFFKYDPEIQFFRLLDEEDHQFSFTDFIDFVTSPECTSTLEGIGEDFQENLIYSYNIINEVDELTFRTDDNKVFVIAGVSLVRRGNEITIFASCGERINYKELKKSLKDNDPLKSGKYYKPGIKPHPDLNTEPILLLDTKNFQKVLVASRFDIGSLKSEVNYLMKDYNSSFMIKTDDPDGLTDLNGDFLEPELEKALKNGIESIDKHKALFEILTNCLHLPSYFDNNDEEIKDEDHPTALQNQEQKKLFRKDKNYDPGLRIKSRTVWTLDKTSSMSSDSTILFNDEIQIDRSGFYKRLDHDKLGRDKNGQKIHGKTWVDKIQTWYESDKRNKPLIIDKKNQKVASGNNPGVIYIMRNASHDKDIFKVGLTTRTSEIRAKELSGTTSSADKFLVAQEWNVADCTLIEKLIHAKLDSFRINERREFFKIGYSELIKVIEQVIEENPQLGTNK